MTEHRCDFVKEFETNLTKRCSKQAIWIILVHLEHSGIKEVIYACNEHKDISLQMLETDEDVTVCSCEEEREKVEFT